jgi:hypothetical protein
MRPRTTLGWCMVIAVLVLSTPAWAHVETASDPGVVSTPFGLETLLAAPVVVDGAWLLVLTLASVAIARDRRRVAGACLAVLLLIAFEAGVHSVHHMADQPDSQCVVASASAHTSCVTVEGVGFERPAEMAAAVAFAPLPSRALRPPAASLGRAPPAA